MGGRGQATLQAVWMVMLRAERLDEWASKMVGRVERWCRLGQIRKPTSKPAQTQAQTQSQD
eukprot:15349735-Alexandrium_andersonii.AAC.1